MVLDSNREAVLAAALEAFLHQLLYMTNVYPSDSFAKTAFLGIVGYTNRHAGVVQYVSQCIQVGVPVLLNGGEMIVLVGEKERFIIGIQCDENVPLQLLEARLRDLILSVHSQDRRKEKNESFKIKLKPGGDDCPALVRGMSQGLWYQEPSLHSDNEPRELRPIHDLKCGNFMIAFRSERTAP